MDAKEAISRASVWLNWYYEGDQYFINNDDAKAMETLKIIAGQYQKWIPLIEAVEKSSLPGDGRTRHGHCFRWIADENNILEVAFSLMNSDKVAY